MKRILLSLAFALVGVFAFAAVTRAAPPATQQAVFAGGCFWCMEHDMGAIRGVVSVESGYTGGKGAHPTYEQVSGEQSGHYESVRVTFDPSKIGYDELLFRYWKLVDPTDDGGQFCDRGPSYRTAVFVANPAQRKAAEASRAEAARRLKHGKIITPILPLGPFWPAEAEHRNFAKTHAEHYTQYRTGCGRDAKLAQVWAGG